MADGEVLINTKINTDGAKEDLKKLKEELRGSADTASKSAEKIEKSFDDVDLENAADGLGESFKKETKQAKDSVEVLAGELPESYRTIFEKIEKIRADDTKDSKTKIEQIQEQYEILGQFQERAFREAFEAVKSNSDHATRRVVDNLKEIAREAEETASDSIGSKLGSALGKLSGIPGGELIGGVIGGIAASLTQKATELLAEAGRALVDFGKEAIEMASDLEEVKNVVEVTFGDMSGEVDEFAKNAIKSAGMSETMANKYVGTFGSMAKSFGFTTQEAFDMSTSLTQLTGDVASFYNLDHDEAYTKLKSVFTGETEALKELGVVMTQSALDQYAMEKGIKKTTAQMTEQEKVALRYDFVLEQLSGAAGDFERNQDSWANQTRVLTEQWNSFQTTVGEGLKEALLPFLQFTNNSLMPALQDLGEGISWILNPQLPEEYKQFLDEALIPSLGDVVDLMTYGFEPEKVEELTTKLTDAATEMENVREKSAALAASQKELQEATEATAAQVENLKLEYETARDAAKKSIDSQIGLLTELETKSDKSAREMVDNWKKQREALQNYAKNLQKAIDMGLDEALVQQIMDAGIDMAPELDAIVNATDVSVDEINAAFRKTEEAKQIVANTMADIQTGTSRKLQQIAQDTKNQWGDMADVVGASVADMQEYIDSLTGRQVYVDVIGRYNGSTIPNAYGSAFGGGYNPYSFTGYSVDATSYVPYLAEGAVIPPNAPFTAVLGDQRNGYNLEGPEEMFRSIVREELGNAANEETNELLWNILQAVQGSRVISINGREVFEEMVDENNRAIQSLGRSPLTR